MNCFLIRCPHAHPVSSLYEQEFIHRISHTLNPDPVSPRPARLKQKCVTVVSANRNTTGDRWHLSHSGARIGEFDARPGRELTVLQLWN